MGKAEQPNAGGIMVHLQQLEEHLTTEHANALAIVAILTDPHAVAEHRTAERRLS